MRVRRLSLTRLRDEEQGAVLAMVAISLMVLIGMAVLTFDLGRGVALKRNMVNAADAGALAAARECGLANGEASAKAAAGELVADNNGAAKVTGFQIDPSPAVCSGGGNPDPDGKNTVTVTVTVPQEYFFAQIFGFNSGQRGGLRHRGVDPATVGSRSAQGGGTQGGRMPQGRDGLALLRGATTTSTRSMDGSTSPRAGRPRASPTPRCRVRPPAARTI